MSCGLRKRIFLAAAGVDDWADGFAEHPLQMIVCMMIGACIGVVLGRFIVTPWLDWLYATLHRLTGFAF